MQHVGLPILWTENISPNKGGKNESTYTGSVKHWQDSLLRQLCNNFTCRF